MKLQQIEYVMEVARVGSMNQAAKNLFVSQPHLSSTVAELEKSLNITIFRRTSKGVELTPVGEKFIKSCRYVTEQLEYMRSLQSLGGSEERTMTLISNCHNTVASSIMLDMTREDDSRRTHFSFLTAPSISILTDIAEQKYNIGLLVVPELEMSSLQGVLNAKRLQLQCLLKEDGCVLVGRNNPLYRARSLTIRQCTAHPIVMFNDDWERTFTVAQISAFRNRFTVDDKESLFNAIFNGNCIALADPTVNSLSRYITSGDIRPVPLDKSERMSYFVGWVSRRGAELPALEQEFIDRYTKRLEQMNAE